MKILAGFFAMLLCAGLVITSGAAYADDRSEYRYDKGDKYYYKDKRHYKDKHHYKRKPYVVRRGPVIVVPEERRRHYRDIVIYRPYGHWYHGYGHHHADSDAFMWLAFTAITLKILDNLNEQQQRAHEAAQIRATTAPVGETIVWNQGGASGSVTTIRDGTSTSGRYCREFQQEVTVGGRREIAYGTACQQPDGAWEIISTETP